MRPLDWSVLILATVGIVVYGVWKGRGDRDIEGYLLSNRSLPWYAVALSVMATQASAATFLTMPGQAYAEGVAWVQFYFGLPLAVVVLSVTAIPLYRRLNVYTAYEFLEERLDLKTRALAVFLFLIQRALAAGLTIFTPALVISTILGLDILVTNIAVGVLVIIYTTFGGSRAVSWTQFHQMIIILFGITISFVLVVRQMPEHVSLLDATRLAGSLGRLEAVNFSFDLTERYTIWSGLIGGFFLQMAYFGTDQSQVQRVLNARSIRESRLGLLFNGLVKIPMQFFILFLGAMVLVFYQFVEPPIFFNQVPTQAVRSGPDAAEFADVERRYALDFENKRGEVEVLLQAIEAGDDGARGAARERVRAAEEQMLSTRDEGIELMQRIDPGMDTNDANYVFLGWVMDFLPTGLVGLILAAIMFASMSSAASELNALASTTVVDIYKRAIKPEASDKHYLLVAKLSTVIWGIYAIFFGQFLSRLGTIVVAVNIVGSIFYGTVLGIFLVAFYSKRISGTAVFMGALIAEVAVIACYFFTEISFLWYNLVGCVLTVLVAALLQIFLPPKQDRGGVGAAA
ncbi:MAG: sodium:solute symporter [Acidobacteriota bacterium]|nr:sodium:solute symporter [Acidobacteriota bacterium]